MTLTLSETSPNTMITYAEHHHNVIMALSLTDVEDDEQLSSSQRTHSMLAELTSEVRSMRQEIIELKEQLKQQSPLAGITSTAARPPLRSGKSSVRDPFFAVALKRAHPMYVVKISTLLAPSFQHFRPHEELKAAGMLVEWQDGMGDVIFCSHTWLRWTHPDSEMREKFLLLTGLLRKIQAGKLDIYPEAGASMILPKASKRLRITAANLKRSLADGYVFFDYMSIPQQDVEAQQRAVISLGSYVSASSYFFVLAGPWRHENGSIRDDFAWNDRGWCRMELTANMLSPTPKPMVLAKSVGCVEAHCPGGKFSRDWLLYSIVGKGAFTVDGDRAKLGAHLLDIIAARKALALADSDLIYYRMLHAVTAHLLQGTGCEPQPEPFDAWMATMKFTSVRDGSAKGLTPLFFAILANRVELVEPLLQQGAEINRPVKHNDPELTLVKGASLLCYACWFGASRMVIELLLKAGANPRQKIPFIGQVSIHIAIMTGNTSAMELLLDADPTSIEALDGFGNPAWMNFMAAPDPLPAYNLLRSRYPEQLPRWMTAAPVNTMGQTAIAALIGIRGADEVYDVFMDTGLPFCDPEVRGKSRGAMSKIMVRGADLLVRTQRRHNMGIIPVFAYGTRCPAIHMAALAGNLGVLEKLIDRQVDMNSIEHPWRMTPLHLAVFAGHDAICERLIEVGAAIDLKDKRGRTPLQWAKRLGREDIMQLLLGALRRKQVGKAPAVTAASAASRVSGPAARVAPKSL